MDVRTCPDERALRAYHLGEVSEAALESLAALLRDCPSCLERMAAIGTEDDALLHGLRRTPPPAPTEEPLRRAVEQLLKPGGARRPAAGDRLGEYLLLEP